MSAEVASIAAGKQRQPPAAAASIGWSLSKITPPSLSAVAPNGRLFALLDAALAQPVVWLQGPPGAGKTTLAAGWLCARRLDPVWHRLDADDSDPSTLFFNLGMAEARACDAAAARDAPAARGAHASRRLPLLTPEYRFGTDAFSRNFFRKLFQGATPPIVVFDDYHELDPASPVHDLLADGMKEIPQGGHVLVISRFPPPRQFARLRVNGQMEVLAPEHLLLRAEEAAAIAQARGARLDAGRIAQALDATQGWTAGLILLLEAARSGAPTSVGEPGAPELLFDYFAGEVLRGFGERERQTLIGLAFMPSMTAAAAERLTGDAEAGALLERLARRGYFTTRDGEAEPHYRFHPLFQQFLGEQARQAFDADEMRRLKLRAARALEEGRQPDAAVSLLREAAAWDELAQLVKAWASRMEATGRLKTLASWIDLLPPEYVEADGWLLYWAAVARTPFSPDEGRPFFRRALAVFTSGGDADGALLAASRLAISIFAVDLADQTELDPLIVTLRQLVARFPSISSPSIEAYVAYALYGALSRRTSERAEIALWRDRALAAAVLSGDTKLQALVRFGAVVFSLSDAKFAQAKDELAAMARPETLNDAPYERTVTYFSLILAQFYRQIPGSCVETASLAYRDDSAAGVAVFTGLNAALAAVDCVAAADLAAAQAWLQRSAAHMDRLSSRRSPMYHIANAIVACAKGDLAEAEKAARRGAETAAAVDFIYHEAISRLALAQLLLLTGKVAEAEAQIAGAEAAIERSASALMRPRLDLTRAALLLKSGRSEQGLDALRAALAEGERTGARRMALIRPLASALYSEALAHDMSPDYVRLLIRLESLPPPDDADANWPRPLKIVTLGGFELLKDGEPLALARKTPRRLFNLLKAIAAFRGRDVPQEKILDAVWPEEDGDSARQSFDVAIHRLRKLIGDNQAIVVKGGKIGFDPGRCFLDVWAVEKACACKNPPSETAERGLKLYHGDFLAGDEDLPWTAPLREKLRAHYVRAIETQASAWLAAGDFLRAADVYGAAVAACPDAEPLYQGFFRCCAATGRKTEAIEAYRHLHSVLAEAGRKPSPTTEACFRSLAG